MKNLLIKIFSDHPQPCSEYFEMFARCLHKKHFLKSYKFVPHFLQSMLGFSLSQAMIEDNIGYGDRKIHGIA